MPMDVTELLYFQIFTTNSTKMVDWQTSEEKKTALLNAKFWNLVRRKSFEE
jgi:hypothetical protein